MKAKLFFTLIITFAISCSPREEKKQDTPKEEAPSEESAPVEETEVSDENVAPKEEAPAIIEESKTEQPNDANLESIGTGDGSSSGNGAGYGSGSGAVKSKKIEVKKDITVGEEGVR